MLFLFLLALLYPAVLCWTLHLTIWYFYILVIFNSSLTYILSTRVTHMTDISSNYHSSVFYQKS